MAVQRRLMTAEELAALPDDGMRHELIDGELKTLSPAGGPHGDDGYWFQLELGNHVKRHRLGRCFLAETGFLIRQDPDTVRAPDFAFIRADRLPKGRLPPGYLTIAPDLVVEVVSPSDSAAEVRDKVDEWLRFGCRAVWVLYPGPRLVKHGANGSPPSLGPDDIVEGGDVLPGFQMRLRDMVPPTD